MFSTCRKRIFFVVELFQVGDWWLVKVVFFLVFGGEDIQRIEKRKRKEKKKTDGLLPECVDMYRTS